MARLREAVAENGVVFEMPRGPSDSGAGGAASEVRLHAPARATAPLGGPAAGEAFALLAAVAEFLMRGMEPDVRRKTSLSGCYSLETRPATGTRLFRSLTLGLAGGAATASHREAVLEDIERRLRLLRVARFGPTKASGGARSRIGCLEARKHGRRRPGPSRGGRGAGRP